MLYISECDLDAAVERLVIAVRNAKDRNGLRVFVRLPQLAAPGPSSMRMGTADSDVNPLLDPTDWQRVRAITLGAIVALANGPCRVDDGSIDVGLKSEKAAA